jgi:hypothetical protein
VVDLDEDDFRQIEGRPPTQALHVEPTRRLEVTNAERQKVKALLHRCIMHEAGPGQPTGETTVPFRRHTTRPRRPPPIGQMKPIAQVSARGPARRQAETGARSGPPANVAARR